MKMKKLEFKFEVKSLKKDGDSNDCIIEGYANTNDKDRVGDVVLPTAFKQSLPMYLRNPVMLENHDWGKVAGKVTSAEIDDKGLHITARVSDSRPDLQILVREGCLSTFSIGYNELDADMDEATQTKVIKNLELLEISIVSVPANPEAIFAVQGSSNTPATDTTPSDDESDDEAEPKSAKPGSVKSAQDLRDLITAVKGVVSELDNETVLAVLDYFEKENTMTTKEMIALLNSKGAKITDPAVAKAAADKAAAEAKKKADAKAKKKASEDAGDAAASGGSAAPAEEAPASEEAPDSAADKEVLAKLDVLAQAISQIMEALKKIKPASSDDDATGDDDSDSAEASDGDEAKGEDAGEEKPAEPAADGDKPAPKCKCGGKMEDKDDEMMKCSKCGKEQKKPAAAAPADDADEQEKILAEIASLEQELADLDNSETA